MKLNELKAGQSAVVESVGGKGALRQHLLDMGMIPGSRVKMLGAAPMGDPVEILVHSYSLSLRLSEAGLVKLVPLDASSPAGEDSYAALQHDDTSARIQYLHEHNSHPGYGEEGKYHRDEDNANALPRDAELCYVL